MSCGECSARVDELRPRRRVSHTRNDACAGKRSESASASAAPLLRAREATHRSAQLLSRSRACIAAPRGAAPRARRRRGAPRRRAQQEQPLSAAASSRALLPLRVGGRLRRSSAALRTRAQVAPQP
jgi:hypothetical protein